MVLEFAGCQPEIHPEAFLAPHSVIIGQVKLAARSSIWFHAVIRGDNAPISVGAGSNLQENVVCHADSGFPLSIGQDCTIGHGAILHGCCLEDRVLVGMAATILNGAHLESDVILGAGSLVPEGMRLDSGHLYLGTPARKIRPLRAEEFVGLQRSALNYQAKIPSYRQLLEGPRP